MSYLVVLPRMRIENANAISGLTYGFPAITHFLGFTHALSRKLQKSQGLTFTGCGVVCHQHQILAHKSDARSDHYFSLTRNPLTKDSKTAPFNEEGRMHMTVTLFIECQGIIENGDSGAVSLAHYLQSLCMTQRLASGTILSVDPVRIIALPQSPDELSQLSRREMYRAMPGFALVDRSELLAEQLAERHKRDPQAEMLDAWLEFASMTWLAERQEDDTAIWHYNPKLVKGYLVPLMVGFTAISRLYSPGEVAKTRDPSQPFCFAEAVYGVGEWRSPHRVNDIQQLLWRYPYSSESYVCSQIRPFQEDDLTQQEHSDF